MLLYYTNDEKTLSDKYENLFTKQIVGNDEFNRNIYSHSFRNNRNVAVKSPVEGITGLICAFPDDYFINAEQVPPAGPNNILLVVKFFGSYVRTLKSMFIKPTHPASGSISDLRFDGMLIASPDEHISLFIPPIPQGTHYNYHSILNGFNNGELGKILFSGIKHVETSFVYKGEELTISKPSFLHHTESFKGTILNVNSRFSIGDKVIGTIHSATLSSTTNRSPILTDSITVVDRLFAFCNDAYTEHIGVLFAYYHIKRLGLGIKKSTTTLSSGMLY